ncbi:VOC family protein [Cellulosimicrobium arenosum]|uniref:VOC family protein n=1 Tax=Cellulosimicrobium arenosum TaxID=2708133 RepID=A0A927G7N6_9MICO|nr:VOC family protein [Cellulosimicrobium arenosum]MBD8078436.1 VOC family protein [Cellulosimicrobium arenosum]
MTTTIGRTVLMVRDLDTSAAFWTQGLGFRTLFSGESDGFPLLHVGPGEVTDPGLWLVPLPDGAASARRPGFPSLVLYVDDLDATLARLAGVGVDPVAGPDTDPDDGDRFAHVLDPDGHRVVLVRLAARQER